MALTLKEPLKVEEVGNYLIYERGVNKKKELSEIKVSQVSELAIRFIIKNPKDTDHVEYQWVSREDFDLKYNIFEYLGDI